MPRKHYDNKPFPYKIQLFDRETYSAELARRRAAKRRMVVESIRWKQAAINRMKFLLCNQITRMKSQLKRRWYCYYSVFAYGAPSRGEFLCPATSMRARRINEGSSLLYRQYYAKCINASRRVLKWLCDLDAYEYTFELHSYLLKLVVVSRPGPYQSNEYKKGIEEKISRALQ